MNWLKPTKRIFPDTSGRKLTPELGEFRRKPTHLNKACKNDAIDFRPKKSAHQLVHGQPMIIRYQVSLSGEEHLLKLLDVRSHPE